MADLGNTAQVADVKQVKDLMHLSAQALAGQPSDELISDAITIDQMIEDDDYSAADVIAAATKFYRHKCEDQYENFATEQDYNVLISVFCAAVQCADNPDEVIADWTRWVYDVHVSRGGAPNAFVMRLIGGFFQLLKPSVGKGAA